MDLNKIFRNGIKPIGVFLGLIAVMLIFNHCGGAAAPSASIPLPSLTISTDIQTPAVTSLSVNALVTGSPQYSITESSVPDGALATLHNLSRPVSSGNNLISAVIVSGGKANFAFDSSLVQAGDVLLVKGGSNMWQVHKYTNPNAAASVTIAPTNLSTTLAYESLKDTWTDNGISANDVTAIDVTATAHENLQLDESCYAKFLRETFKSDLNSRGMGGQIGVIRNMFAAALIDDNLDYNTIRSEFFGSGSWSESTAEALNTKLAELLNYDNTQALDRVWQAGANASRSLSTILSGNITKKTPGVTNTFCNAIDQDTAETFVAEAADTMIGLPSISDFNQTFGALAKVEIFMDVMDTYQDDTTGVWSFDDKYNEVAVGNLFKTFNSTETDVVFTAADIESMIQYLPKSNSGTEYADDFYEDWSSAMYETYKDVEADGNDFDSQAASVFWSMQMLGGGLELEQGFESIDYGTIYDGFLTDFQGQSGFGDASFDACLVDPAACQSLYTAGGETLSGNGFGYDPGNIGGVIDNGFSCGNLVCESELGEDSFNCPFDCFDNSLNLCGNGFCEPGENLICSIDCLGDFDDPDGDPGDTEGTTGEITIDLIGFYSVNELGAPPGNCDTLWKTDQNSGGNQFDIVSVNGLHEYDILSYSPLYLTIYSNVSCSAIDPTYLVDDGTGHYVPVSTTSCVINGDGNPGTTIDLNLGGDCQMRYNMLSKP